MLPLDIALYTILDTSLAFSIIELGLTGYVASAWTGSHHVAYYDPWPGGYGYENVNVSAPPIVDFLLFIAVWTTLATGASLFLPWFFTRKGFSSKLNMILGIVFTAIYFLTMVFWLASFADIASYLGGSTNTSDNLNLHCRSPRGLSSAATAFRMTEHRRRTPCELRRVTVSVSRPPSPTPRLVVSIR